MIQEIFATAAVASLPLVEQRLAIPLGYFSWDLTIGQAVLAGVIGNIVSVAIVLWLLPIITAFVAKHSLLCNRILQKIFAKTRAKHSHKFETWGQVFLIVFVMIPLPGSGGWTGALVAWLFGVKYWVAMKYISIGLILGALIVAGMTVGAEETFQLFSEVFVESSS